MRVAMRVPSDPFDDGSSAGVRRAHEIGRVGQVRRHLGDEALRSQQAR